MEEVEFKKELVQLYEIAFRIKDYTSNTTEESLLTNEQLDGLLQYLKDNILTYDKMKKMSNTPEHKIIVAQAMDIIFDYVTDIFIENKQYQHAYFLLNEWNKRIFNLTTKVSAFSFLKLAYVRCIAIQDDAEIDLKNNPKSKLKDSYEKIITHIKNSIYNFKESYQKFIHETSSLSQENKNFLNFLRGGLLEKEKIDTSWLSGINIKMLTKAVNEESYDVLVALEPPSQLATEEKFKHIVTYLENVIEIDNSKKVDESEEILEEPSIEKNIEEPEIDGFEPIQDEAIEIVEKQIVEETMQENRPLRRRRRRVYTFEEENPAEEELSVSLEMNGQEQVASAGGQLENGGKIDMQDEGIEVDVEATIIDEYNELKQKMENMPDNSTDFLYTELRLIEVIYRRMRMLDKKIADKENELESIKKVAVASLDEKINQLKRVLEERSEGVSLAGIRPGLESKIKKLEERKKQIELENKTREENLISEMETLQTQKNSLSDEYGNYIEDSKKFVEDIERGDN